MLAEKILTLKNQALAEIQKASQEREVLNLKIKYLGRKSALNEILKGLKDLPAPEKKEIGQLANGVKAEIFHALEETQKKIATLNFNWEKERIDLTLPGKKIRIGHLHLLSQIQNEIEDIFSSLGFEISEGPEVETEFYNFDALNIPANHPARDKWDTFWLKSRVESQRLKVVEERVALRPHTSPVQVRYMEKNRPPFRIISPGKCFRCEATDPKHEHTFYQFEALMVGKDVNVGNFKYIGEQFFSNFFKKKVLVRLRPSFFPFTEPSFEFDISCTVCGGQGCRTCKQTGWLEIGGAGMVNQAVFVAAGYPRNKYQGFAWGFGLERLAMMKYKIDDIRLFHNGDLRFIRQF